MPSSLRWFGVKLLVRTVAVGRVRGRDDDYDREGTLVEERVLIVRARDGRDAFFRARRRVLKDVVNYRNVYGQAVRNKILSGYEAYALYDPPFDGGEVFSRTIRVPRTVRDQKIVGRLIDGQLSETNQRKRRRFIAADLIPGLDSIWARRRLTGR
jgi:hypothetical protein